MRDFGDEWFLGPLRTLVPALHEEAALNPLGRFAAIGQLLKLLRERLWTQHWLREHPGIAERPLSPPVIVVGPMRSGTTRLHRLLAADRRFAHLRLFETICPVPPPDFRRRGPDKRPRRAARILGAVHRFNPHTAVIHPTAPFAPEEELGLLVASVWGMKHEAQWHVPSYGRWSEGQDATPAYRHMALLLRLVGWARGGEGARPWVLKTPQHMLDLPALLAVFPDARLIFIHRDPTAVVGSSCSLVWNQMIIHSDAVDARRIGRDWLRKTELQIERMRAARETIPASRRIDVRYEEMDRDWPAVMARIYRFLDREIAPALPAMVRYMAGAERRRRRHPHRYSLAAFGLAAPPVRERFRSYAEAFGLTPGRAGQEAMFSAAIPAHPRATAAHPAWMRP
ncbi:MAG TPA: sulfotransferase [Sphingomonas sp.]|nr:sulfotransferase [Sphingomonas sp.]